MSALQNLLAESLESIAEQLDTMAAGARARARQVRLLPPEQPTLYGPGHTVSRGAKAAVLEEVAQGEPAGETAIAEVKQRTLQPRRKAHYNQRERAFIKAAWGFLPDEKIAGILGRPVSGIAKIRSEEGLVNETRRLASKKAFATRQNKQ